jgi:hypothetical protein
LPPPPLPQTATPTPEGPLELNLGSPLGWAVLSPVPSSGSTPTRSAGAAASAAVVGAHARAELLPFTFHALSGHPNGPALPSSLGTPTPTALLRRGSSDYEFAAAVLQQISTPASKDDDRYALNLRLLDAGPVDFGGKSITSAVPPTPVAGASSALLALPSRAPPSEVAAGLPSILAAAAAEMLALDAGRAAQPDESSDSESDVYSYANVPVPRKRKGQEEPPEVLMTKRLRRRERCRLAAIKFRSRKREEVGDLQERLAALQTERGELAQELEGLKKRASNLKAFMLAHKDCPGIQAIRHSSATAS